MTDFFVFTPPPSGAKPQTGVTTFNIFGDDTDEQTEDILAPVPQVSAPSPSVPPWQKYAERGESLTDEMILKDPELMAVVDRALETRFGGRSTLAGVTTGVLGGATARFEGKSPEERLEIWNNYQRSFAGGQSVTTVNELAFLDNATDEEKAAIGASYMLFDQKGNIFTGTETWGETFDGVFDYARAVIHDPVTLASLGVGKAMASGGTKAAAMALKVTAKEAFKQSLKSGATREVARQAAKKATRAGFATLGAKTVAQYSALDFAANVGSDIAYQSALIDTKAQEDYSFVQTGVAALGTLAIPSIIAATKGVEALATSVTKAGAKRPSDAGRSMFEAYVDVQRKFGHLDITNVVRQRVDLSQVNEPLKTTFQNFNDNLDKFVPWTQAKVQAGKVLNKKGIELTAGENQSLFWKSFLFGDTQGTQKGFAQALSDAGFVYVPRGEDDKITNFISDAMSWLDDATVKDIVSNFEQSVGKAFDGSIDTAEQLSAAFKNRQSVFGSGLFDSKQARDILTKGGTVGDLAKDFSRETVEDHAEVGKYVLSVWKRLVTAHPATTGLNVKGWAYMTAANDVSDVVLGGLKFAEAGVYKTLGKQDAYEAALRAGKGSVLGAIRRGQNVFSPTATREAAENYLMLKPELYEKMFRNSSGGVDGMKALEYFNIDPANKAANLTEKGVHALQTITGVHIQDEITKVISFQSALDQGIMREYGQTFNEFMSRQDAYTEMFTPRFRERVDAWALNRTLRETASKNWTLKQGRGVALATAKIIEGASRNAIGGYAIPFGSFMNTAFATLGDYSGFNAVKHLTARGLNKTRVVNYTFDFAEEEGMELFAKGLVGWGALVTLLPESVDKVEKGLTWNQEERSDGSISDVTYDFPLSYFKIASQMAAHYVKDGEIPASLAQEAFVVFGGQPFRQMDGAGREAMQIVNNVLTAEFSDAVSNSLSALAGLGSRILSGAMRPLDPINQAAILMSDDYTQIDRKQASNKFLAGSLRYVDHIFGGFEAPAQTSPTRGYRLERPDPGKTLGGVRSSAAPNSIERVLAAVGKAPWQAVRWDGDDQVKNSMDGIIGPILNAEAERMLRDNPEFFTKSIASREKAISELTERSKNIAKQVLEYSFKEEDTVTKLKMDLAKIPKKNVKRAMDYLGYEGDPTKVVQEEGGLEKLEMLIYFAKNFDELLVE